MNVLQVHEPCFNAQQFISDRNSENPTRNQFEHSSFKNIFVLINKSFSYHNQLLYDRKPRFCQKFRNAINLFITKIIIIIFVIMIMLLIILNYLEKLLSFSTSSILQINSFYSWIDYRNILNPAFTFIHATLFGLHCAVCYIRCQTSLKPVLDLSLCALM